MSMVGPFALLQALQLFAVSSLILSYFQTTSPLHGRSGNYLCISLSICIHMSVDASTYSCTPCVFYETARKNTLIQHRMFDSCISFEALFQSHICITVYKAEPVYAIEYVGSRHFGVHIFFFSFVCFIIIIIALDTAIWIKCSAAEFSIVVTHDSSHEKKNNRVRYSKHVGPRSNCLYSCEFLTTYHNRESLNPN